MSAGSTTNPETQPLLQSSEPTTTYQDEPNQGPRRAADGGDEESNVALVVDDANSPKTTPLSTIALRAAIVILLIVPVGFFIKGLIDLDGIEFDLGKALQKALGGGLSGAAAMVLQVLTLMPLRTIMNYQYRYGTTTTEATMTLYADGGWTRYYQGLAAALIQGPVSRFGDTAANAGILALLQSNPVMKKLPVLVKTIFTSVAAACFRMVLTPIDTVKTTMQTQGKDGIALLRARLKKHGIGSLWYGALATAAATFVGHYPWFGTYNYLDANLPLPRNIIEKLLRSAFIGFMASIASDSISNSLRVIKTYRQVYATRIGYFDAARAVVSADGIRGLLGRGLGTRILANSLQGIMFSVLWKLFMDLWNSKMGGTHG